MNLLKYIIVIAIVIIIFAAIYHFQMLKAKNAQIADLQKDNLKLILDSIKQNPTLSNEVKNQIEKLVYRFNKIDDKISKELTQALELIQINQTENAIGDLVKIIERRIQVFNATG